MEVFSVEAHKLGMGIHVGVCGCGMPIPALLIDQYEAEFECPRCGRQITVKIGVGNTIRASIKSS